MKMKTQLTNRILSLVLAFVMVLGMVPMTAYAATSGTCGDGVNFTIDNNVLTITGSGAVKDFAGANCWYGDRESITKIIIGNGVKLSNKEAFYYHTAVTSVEYGNTVGTIGDGCFDYCKNLSSLTLREGVGVSGDAFFNCRKLYTSNIRLVDANGNDKTEYYTKKLENYMATHPNELTIKGNLAKGSIADIPPQQYISGAVKPAVTVTWNGQTVSSRNYNVTYSNNTDPGTEIGKATVTVTGKGNYTGTITKEFEILPLKKIDGITLSTGSSEIPVGGSSKISASISPDNATVKELKWSVADPGVASVVPNADGKSCMVTGLAPGTTVLTVAAQDGSGQIATCNINVAYKPSPSFSEFKVTGHTYKNGDTYWFAPGATAEVTPPMGYMISKQKGSDFVSSVTLTESETATVYLKQNLTNAQTDAIDLSSILKWDITAPTGSINLSPHAWDDLNINSSFNVFSKGDVEISITAQDTESGLMSIQYYISNEDLIGDNTLDSAAAIAKLEETLDPLLEEYNGAFSLHINNKYVVYAKLTDKFGNVSYLSSDGIVLYSDATSTTTSLTTTYKAGEGKDISVALNGNTVNEVKCNDTALAGTDYTVSGDKITLKSEYLDTLAAGEYTLTVSLNPLGEIYMEYPNNSKPAELTVNLTVNKRQVAVPAEDNRSFVYDGSEQTYSITPSDWYTVTGDKQTNAGTYTVTVSLKDQNSTVWDDGTTEDKTYTFHIEKKTVDLSGVKWNYTEAFKYDGMTHGVAIDESTLPEGASVSHYTGDSYIDTGKYQAVASIIYDDNYEGEATLLLDWEIKNDWTPTEYTVSAPNDNGWWTTNVVITAADGYKVSLTNTADGKWEDRLTCSEETADGSVTFYLKNMTDWTISLGKTVTYKLDKTAPAGRVAFDERNGWEEFLNTITFGLFFKDEVTVKVTTNNDISGIAKIEYASSEDPLILDQVMHITDWKEYKGSFVVTKPEAQRFVYFIRITDNAGHISYLSTDGAEYDTTAPVISGIEDGKTYYTTQKVTVTDKNIDTITLNGEPAGENITLEGNKDTAYTIAVTDKAGNTTTVTVTMKPISELSVPIDTLTNDNVNSGDERAVDGVKAAVAAVDTTNATEEEKAALQEIADKAAELEKVIDDVKAEIARINEELKKFDGDTVNSDDAKALKQLGKDIKALTDGNHLTDAERAAFTKAASDVAAMQKTVADTVAENNRISDEADGYDLATVTSDDKEDLEQLLADIEKQLKSTNLTKEEISQLNGDKKTVEDLLAKIKSIEELIDKLISAVNGYSDDTVKSTDQDAIEQAIEDIDALTQTKNLTEDEKKALEETKEKAEGLLDTIEKVAKATETENTEKARDITAENVTPEDKTDLEKAKADLEKALEENGGNYTDEEKKAIEGEIKRIDDALKVIGNVEAVEELIDKLPDTVKKDDEAAIKAADDAYNALSDYEKALVDEDAKKALEDAKVALAWLNSIPLWIVLVIGIAIIALVAYNRKRKNTAKNK